MDTYEIANQIMNTARQRTGPSVMSVEVAVAVMQDLIEQAEMEIEALRTYQGGDDEL